MESEDLFFSNMIDHYYKNRPNCLRNISLHSLNTKYDYKKKQCVSSHTECLSLKNSFGYLHKRSNDALIKV
jgi:hypothetical protein